MDSDIEVDEVRAAPLITAHRLRTLGAVAVGGALGTATRYLATGALATGPLGDVPQLWATLPINVLGALLLGVLLEELAGRGPDHGRRRALRLLLGTGFLGGFTTYSTLAVDTDQLLHRGLAGAAVGYGLGTLLLGAVASMAGIALATRVRRSRNTRRLTAERR
nr:CrcB family protein [Microlunatus panaciterrae]